MKHTKEVVIPARTETRTEFVTCDLCKNKIPRVRMYEVDEVEISHEVGTCFPDGTDTALTSFDLCGKCFDEKLVPWLVSQGAEPSREDPD